MQLARTRSTSLHGGYAGFFALVYPAYDLQYVVLHCGALLIRHHRCYHEVGSWATGVSVQDFNCPN